MKLALALAALTTTATAASADSKSTKPVPPTPGTVAAPATKETAAEKTARAFLKTIVETPDALGIPKTGITWTFQIRDGVKGCEGMFIANGTANTAPLAGKLKACIAAAYKSIGQGGAVAKIGLGELDNDKFVGHFSKADQKKVKDLTVGTKVIEADLNGDGESLTISLAVHPVNGVIAVWMEAEAVE